jgi:hypothetical protein
MYMYHPTLHVVSNLQQIQAHTQTDLFLRIEQVRTRERFG